MNMIRTSFKYDNNIICIDEDISKNTITIDGIDYFAYYINPEFKKNKGANSYVFALYQAQSFIDYESSSPDRVIKISNKKDYASALSKSNRRFYREINALNKCKQYHVANVITIYFSGQLSCIGKNRDGKEVAFYFPFYIMDYATSDLKNYLENNQITYAERINLCLQIAEDLKGLNDLGCYHRDLKPDNILMFDNIWKIGDLGLIAFRDEDELYDKKNEFIGPKGWLSPEAMNKYLSYDDSEYKFDCKIDHQSDIFQLGKIFWYIFQGNVPIGGISRSDFFDRRDEVYSLLKYMLNHSKKQRPLTIDYVINNLKRIIQKYSL
ncbi:protein kinase family protein [Bacteroides thetaiotaomicron]